MLGSIEVSLRRPPDIHQRPPPRLIVVLSQFTIHQIDGLIDLQSFGGCQEELATHTGRGRLGFPGIDPTGRNVKGILCGRRFRTVFVAAAVVTTAMMSQSSSNLLSASFIPHFSRRVGRHETRKGFGKGTGGRRKRWRLLWSICLVQRKVGRGRHWWC